MKTSWAPLSKAFASGADGVVMTGCWPADCHYRIQNVKALRRFELLLERGALVARRRKRGVLLAAGLGELRLERLALLLVRRVRLLQLRGVLLLELRRVRLRLRLSLRQSGRMLGLGCLDGFAARQFRPPQ